MLEQGRKYEQGQSLISANASEIIFGIDNFPPPSSSSCAQTAPQLVMVLWLVS